MTQVNRARDRQNTIRGPEFPEMTARAYGQEELPLASLLLISLFWATVYYEPVALVLRGNTGRVCILGLWVISLALAGGRTIQVCFHRAFAHRAELVALTGWLVISCAHFAFRTGGYAYIQFANVLLSAIGYMTASFTLRKQPKQYWLATILILFVLGGVSLIIAPRLYYEPQIARKYDEIYSASDQIRLIGSWGLFSCFAIATPCLFASALSQRGIARLWQLGLCVAILLAISLGTFAAAYLIVAIAFSIQLALFVGRERRLSAKAAVASCALGIFAFGYWRYSEVEQVKTVIEKITGVTEGVVAEGVVKGDPTTRGHLASVSWRAFMQNPIIGVGPLTEDEDNYTQIGRHAAFIDGLAQYGILGYGWYLAFVVLGLRRIMRLIWRENRTLTDEARFATFIAFIVAGFINPFISDASFLVLFYVLVLAPD